MSNIPDNNRLDQDADEEPPPSGEIASQLHVEINVDSHLATTVEKHGIGEHEIASAVIAAAAHRGFGIGEIGVRIADDPTIREINGKHLGHDYPTDVISFGYSADAPHIEGELVVSIDTAIQRASELGWQVKNELLLYIVHGTLHITGMDDHDVTDRAAMRAAERETMTAIGIMDSDRFSVEAHS